MKLHFSSYGKRWGAVLLMDDCLATPLSLAPGCARRGTIDSMTQRFETSQWVPYPVELVFAFFANPSNLPHVMPPLLETRVEDLRIEPPPPRPVAPDAARRFLSVAAGVGSEILISFFPIPWVPRRVSWLTRITEFEWNSHFSDAQVRGPFTSFHHRHGIQTEFRDGLEGTRVSDAVEYALPYGLFGRIAGVLVQRRMQRTFKYRHKRLPEILAAASRQAARRA
jgi:ligand-binding SRPBCC domain-containing protein